MKGTTYNEKKKKKKHIGKKKSQMGNPNQHIQSDHFNDMLAGDLQHR